LFRQGAKCEAEMIDWTDQALPIRCSRLREGKP
jgi:hypothetical protein